METVIKVTDKQAAKMAAVLAEAKRLTDLARTAIDAALDMLAADYDLPENAEYSPDKRGFVIPSETPVVSEPPAQTGPTLVGDEEVDLMDCLGAPPDGR